MDLLILDGSYGEGGGQILRTALSLSALTGRPFRLENIRAGREEPGLRPQHLAAVHAVAAVCDATVSGAALNARALTFEPRSAPRAGLYEFDMEKVAGAGSAGAISLLFQALFLPLALADGLSTLKLSGGTHVRWSPPYHYLTEVYLPVVAQIGFEARLELGVWGWYPRGGGEMVAHIQGIGPDRTRLAPLELVERGKLLEVWGISAASNLPEHIPLRQRDQALQRLRARHLKAEIEVLAPPSPGPGTLLFLLLQYEHVAAGFSGFGRLRYPAERVADDALDELEAYLSSKAAVDPHLADQLLLPLALVPGPSRYTVSAVTRHLLTNRWVIQHFIERDIQIEGAEGAPGVVSLK